MEITKINKMIVSGKIYLIPTFLGESHISRILPALNLEIINKVKYYVVENERTARRALIKMGVCTKISDLTFIIIDKHKKNQGFMPVISLLLAGNDFGILSEAGCPGIADPGSEIVKLAHQNNIDIVPLVGPSSIFLALMASGFNGQSFKFHGYIPVKNPERTKKIKELENGALRFNETQIFIETPYRNIQILNDLITVCNPEIYLCIACDVTLETEYIKTKKIKEWKLGFPDINKRPTVFLIY
jgi:16S rRNA (cytidine1402-2'-O)-methyltransferase